MICDCPTCRTYKYILERKRDKFVKTPIKEFYLSKDSSLEEIESALNSKNSRTIIVCKDDFIFNFIHSLPKKD